MNNSYWLKAIDCKLFLLSYGKDDESPNVFIWLNKGFDCTFKGFRLIIEF